MESLIKDQQKKKPPILNRRRSIHQKCLNCSGWIPKEVTSCSFKDCPLYSFRTGRGKQDSQARSKAIRDYCLWCMGNQVGEVSKCLSLDCPLFVYRKGKMERAENNQEGFGENNILLKILDEND